MAFGPEELDRRRQQREALRQKREREQQQFKTRLIIAAIALAVAAVVIIAVIIGQSAKNKKPEPTTEPTQTYPTVVTEPPGDRTVIHFAATGDLNITDKVVLSGGSELDYSEMIADVMPLLADADLTTVNLEGNLAGPPYGSKTTSAPVQLLQALNAAGVDMLQMANSCTINNGILGLRTTLDAVRSAGLVPLGAYATNEEYEQSGGYTIWEVQGVRVAVVAFTKGMDNMALPAGSENCVNLLYTDYSSKYVEVDTDRINSIMERVSKEKPDVTVALLHWGSEYNDTRSSSQEKIRDLLLEHGVDAIIGTHPHYVQPIAFDKKKGTLVAYSLGDFISDGEKMGTEYSIILDVEITKDNKTGETKVTGYEYTPVYSYSDEEGMVRVLRIEPALFAYECNYLDRVTKEVYDDMTNAQQRIEARVQP